LDRDSDLDFDDISLFVALFQGSVSDGGVPLSVPEPATSLLFQLGWFVLGRVRLQGAPC
jgi:hypothetical protein